MRCQGVIRRLTHHRDTVSAVLFHPYKPILFTCSWDSTVAVWDLRTMTLSSSKHNGTKSIRSMALSPNGESLCLSSVGSLKRICTTSLKLLHSEYTPTQDIINTVSINDDSILFSGSDTGQLCFWKYSSLSCFDRK